MKTKKIVLLFSIIYLFSSFCYADNKTDSHNSKQHAQGTVWFDGNRQREFWIIPDQVAIISNKSAPENVFLSQAQTIIPGGSVLESNGFYVRIKLPENATKDYIDGVLNSNDFPPSISRVTSVYNSDPTDKEIVHILTGEMVVFLNETINPTYVDSLNLGSDVQLIRELPYDNAHLFSCPNGQACIEIANQLYKDKNVKYAYPNWIRARTEKFVSNDPLFNNQWHLSNTGQGGGTSGEDSNILGAWTNQNATGSSTRIAIVDDGLELNHEDLTSSIIGGLSYDWVDGDMDPTAGNHGTSVAGVAAATGGNGIGVTGAAPEAGLGGHRLLGANSDTNESEALTRNNNVFDIYNNSWGPSDTGDSLSGPGPLTQAALASGVINGRSGSGTIFTWAGGNGLTNQDNSNYDGYAASRFTIAIAASDNTGVQSWYSEPGANILINAPSNGGTLGITTTDRTGAAGYDPGNYTSTFGGTSSATPLVSGIISQMLQVNPTLGWRDVQHILAVTASKNDPGHADWVQNGAGYWVNHAYGFGRIDSSAAVALASSWINVPNEISISEFVTPSLPIPASGDPISVNITVTDDINIEYVELTFDSDHTYWGDLDIKLISPSGTESVLAQQHFAGGAQYAGGWTFGISRLLGENAHGTWTLVVSDLYPGDTGNINSLLLAVHGTAIDSITFDDVPPTHWAFTEIEMLAASGITSGCSISPSLYCPDNPVTRAQMAIFILRGIEGSTYLPPDTNSVFGDVSNNYWAQDWITEFANRSITSGCGGGNYCPDSPVTREQMAVFILRGIHGSTYVPPPAGGIFNDVPVSHPYANWIEQLAVEGITGGCGGGNFCPGNTVSRAQMAVFLVRAFLTASNSGPATPEGEYDTNAPVIKGPIDL